jgi:serine/threonine protein kinase
MKRPRARPGTPVAPVSFAPREGPVESSPVRTLGKYRLVEPLASGGMADVWRAEVTGAAGVVKEVALKLVRGEHEAQGEFVRMFIEEARLASRLSHANVVQVFEFDQVDGRYYLAMELVHGRNLARVLDRAQELGLRPGLARAVHVGAEVARALGYAHRASEGGRSLGLVHRDVSPHNVLVSFEGEVKLADFGIARAMSRSGLTGPGTVKGKIAYMAPEQARGDAVDARADVWALGVVLWELCTGRRLFARDSDAAALAAVLEGPPASPPSAWNEAVPPELDAVVMGALEREPARRTASAQELAGALGRIQLALSRSPDDWDLRAFMHRLWPEGATPAPGPALEATRVRPGGPEDAGAAAAEAAALAAGPAEPKVDEGATRTAAAPARTGRRRVRLAALGAAVVLGAAAGVGWAVWKGRAGATLTAASTSTSTPTPTPVATPAAIPNPNPNPSPRSSSSSTPNTARAEPVEARPAAAESTAAPTDTRPGTLLVTASPWAYVTVDGRELGETPVTVALPPGNHRLRLRHPKLGAREVSVAISPAQRSVYTTDMTVK